MHLVLEPVGGFVAVYILRFTALVELELERLYVHGDPCGLYSLVFL
jgi:hypothetical protein